MLLDTNPQSVYRVMFVGPPLSLTVRWSGHIIYYQAGYHLNDI